MSKVLKLYNTFTRSLNEVKLNGKLITSTSDSALPKAGSFYICGPTVYSDSHVGHALTYIRSDLFRRFLKSLFNVRLHTVMNVTDIDDKILDRTRAEFSQEYGDKFPSDPLRHPFKRISEKYYGSFLDDLHSIRVLPADLYIRVSDSVTLIADFIRRLEKNGHAYISDDGDVRFRVQSVQNYVGRTDSRKDSSFDGDSRDFVLWKATKPNEPVWLYKSSSSDKSIPGRPGWHVQCSAISSAIFGSKLDFHFGGKDLIFPHHYNEEACCCAFHSLDTSNTLHAWANHWLHSGHLILRDSKMSKSLGNVIEIKTFIGRSSLNALRLLCVHTHYRTDIEFNDDLIDKLKALDHKLNAFISFVSAQLKSARENVALASVDELLQPSTDVELEHCIMRTQEAIVEGVCDDFHLDNGLESILNLSKYVYSKDPASLNPRDLISCWALVSDWCQTCGLEYGETSSIVTDSGKMAEILIDFRQKVRTSVIDELKANKNSGSQLRDLLKECDNIRGQLDELGFVVRDVKV